IINSRHFNYIDDLIDVKGIGPVTLEKIKTQGLACVEGEESQNTQEEEKAEEEEIEEEEPQEDEEDTQEEETNKEDIKNEANNEEETNKVTSVIQETQKITGEEIKTIMLGPQNIKSEINKEQLNKNKFATYGLITFCLLLVSLFVLKRRKNEKTEFR
ncbi:MAG: hypothetical protein NTZ83_06090, partial [Candidatus Pacearchaeota archaeon]|nr:hypothetical protein [Candidatus Pacearchaeota archaeon]